VGTRGSRFLNHTADTGIIQHRDDELLKLNLDSKQWWLLLLRAAPTPLVSMCTL
jgi:hypothetical protein